MALPPTGSGPIASDFTAKIRRDVNKDEPHSTVGLSPIREATLTGSLFNGCVSHRRIDLQREHCFLPKVLWRANVEYAQRLPVATAKSGGPHVRRILTSSGWFQVRSHVLASIPEATYVTKMEALVIRRCGSLE